MTFTPEEREMWRIKRFAKRITIKEITDYINSIYPLDKITYNHLSQLENKDGYQIKEKYVQAYKYYIENKDKIVLKDDVKKEIEKELYQEAEKIIKKNEISGKELARMRKGLLKIKQEELAKYFGLSKLAISSWETGRQKIPKVKQLIIMELIKEAMEEQRKRLSHSDQSDDD